MSRGVYGAVVVSFFALVSANAAWRTWQSGRVQGGLQVQAIIQSSIQLSVRIAGEPPTVAGGAGATSVLLHLGARSFALSPSSPAILAVTARVANAPQSKSYELRAVWSGCPGEELSIDGQAIPAGSEVDITSNKQSGDPYRKRFDHRMTIRNISAGNSTCYGTLVLIAQPKN